MNSVPGDTATKPKRKVWPIVLLIVLLVGCLSCSIAGYVGYRAYKTASDKAARDAAFSAALKRGHSKENAALRIIDNDYDVGAVLFGPQNLQLFPYSTGGYAWASKMIGQPGAMSTGGLKRIVRWKKNLKTAEAKLKTASVLFDRAGRLADSNTETQNAAIGKQMIALDKQMLALYRKRVAVATRACVTLKSMANVDWEDRADRITAKAKTWLGKWNKLVARINVLNAKRNKLIDKMTQPQTTRP